MINDKIAHQLHQVYRISERLFCWFTYQPVIKFLINNKWIWMWMQGVGDYLSQKLVHSLKSKTSNPKLITQNCRGEFVCDEFSYFQCKALAL